MLSSQQGNGSSGGNAMSDDDYRAWEDDRALLDQLEAENEKLMRRVSMYENNGGNGDELRPDSRAGPEELRDLLHAARVLGRAQKQQLSEREEEVRWLKETNADLRSQLAQHMGVRIGTQ